MYKYSNTSRKTAQIPDFSPIRPFHGAMPRMDLQLIKSCSRLHVKEFLDNLPLCFFQTRRMHNAAKDDQFAERKNALFVSYFNL